MIELSIVLLILSLLVGSLLVGRQIVDRAKIQRIIFEFDYYEKAFHQFYDTYRVVPGNLDYKTCIKHAEFQIYKNKYGMPYKNSSNQVINDMCLEIAWQPGYLNSRKIANAWYDGYTHVYVPQTILSGLLSDRYSNIDQMYHGTGKERTATLMINNIFVRGRNFSRVTTVNSFQALNYNFPSSFDKFTIIQFLGYDFATILRLAGKDDYQQITNLEWHAGSNRYFNTTLPIEYYNANFRRILDKKNALGLFRATTQEDSGISNNVLAASISSRMASELDAKIDDGRPGSGRILALKGGFAHYANTTMDQHIAACYDKKADEVDKAIYHSDTNIKYGCNIIKVMEDVK